MPSAASPQPLAGTHCCYVMTVMAYGDYKIDYGDDLSQQKTGTYELIWGWTTKTISAYDRGALTLRGPGLVNAVFDEHEKVNDVLSKTVPPYEPYAMPEKCDAADRSTPGPLLSFTKVSPEARAKFAQLDTDLKVTPGREVSNWGPRCPQVDGANSHGLHAFLSQSPPVGIRKLKRALAADRDFSVGCWESVAVDDPDPTQHTFTGGVGVRIVFGYFPLGQLDDREQALNDLVGVRNKAGRHLGDLFEAAGEALKDGGGHDCGK
jgi:hypothetical protein